MRALVLAVAIAAFARPADACSCITWEVDDAYRTSKYVVMAKVIGGPETEKTGERHRRFEVQVEGVWKGNARYAMQVATGHGGGDCGRRLAVDQTWIFFANEVETNVMFTSICDRSELATKDAIARMTKKFGAPKNPKR